EPGTSEDLFYESPLVVESLDCTNVPLVSSVGCSRFLINLSCGLGSSRESSNRRRTSECSLAPAKRRCKCRSQAGQSDEACEAITSRGWAPAKCSCRA
ncbi:hypothetical protein HAX54_050038, partial [Datura stramonium]|nr:hypothetical protein [Datura stramonium]